MPCVEESSGGVLDSYYPSFEAVTPPHRSGAIRAWKGELTPFPDDSKLGEIVADLERHATVDIDVGGIVRHSSKCSFAHCIPSYLSRLVKMAVPFEVVILEFEGKRHRQAYCLRPEISSATFPNHPHIRRDQRIFMGRPLDAICPYRSDETHPRSLLEYLDYLAIFLGKHLVWVRTLELRCYSEPIPKTIVTPHLTGAHFVLPTAQERDLYYFEPWITRRAKPTKVSASISRAPDLRWEGIWIGPSAPHDPATLVRTVQGHDECICGSGLKYGVCCRPRHLETLRLMASGPLVA